MEQRPHGSEFDRQPYGYLPDQTNPSSQTNPSDQTNLSYQPNGPGKPPGRRGRTALLVTGGIVGFLVVVSVVSAAFGKHPATTDAGSAASAVPAASGVQSVQSAAPATQAAAAAAASPAAAPPSASSVAFSCTGQAGGGVTITYGPEGSSFGATALPFSKTLPLNSGAQYYVIEAQLQGSGAVSCSTVVSYQDSDGTAHTISQSAAASGGYNIASAEVCSDFTGGWQGC